MILLTRLLGLVTTLKKYPNVAVAIMIEPGALANIILGTCDTSYSIAGVREGLTYAMKALNLPNVITYLDVSHGGILGWTDTLSNLPPPQIPFFSHPASNP